MITFTTNDHCYELRGLSSDNKPIKTLPGGGVIGNGSVFFEIDTCKVFMYDEANHK